MREIVSLLYAACTRVPTYVRIVRQQFMHALLTRVRPCDNLCLFRSYLRVSRISLPTAKLCPGISGYRRHVHVERAFSVSLRTYVWKTRLKWVFHQNSADCSFSPAGIPFANVSRVRLASASSSSSTFRADEP